MSTENFFGCISAFWPRFAPLPGLLRLFFLTALPSQCTCLLLFPLLPCLRVGFDFFSAWLLSPHGNCKLQENAPTELNLDASYISVLLFHASGQGRDWEWVKEQEWNCCKALGVLLLSLGHEVSTRITFTAKWQMRPCPGLTLVVKPDLFGLTSSLLAMAV